MGRRGGSGYGGIQMRVSQAMDDLKDKNFLAGSGGERRRRRTKGLLEEWCIAYRDRLRPELVRGLYQAADPEWWRH